MIYGEDLFENIFKSINNTKDTGLYKTSRKFPILSPDTIEENFTLDIDEDKIIIEDQNIGNIIIETRDHDLEFIKQLISFYKNKKINTLEPRKKRLTILIFIKIIIELEYKLNFEGNYDILFDNDIFPSDPTTSELFDFIRKMNYLLYTLFSNFDTNQNNEMLNTLKSIWDKNEIKWIYNFFPFFNQIIKDYDQSIFTIFTNSSFYTESFLSKSEKDPLLFKFVSKITESNPKIIFGNEKILNYFENYVKYKECRKPLISWLSIGLKIFSNFDVADENFRKIINKIFSLFLTVLTYDKFEDCEKSDALDIIIDSFLPVETSILSTSEIVHSILFQLSTFSGLSTDYYFKFLNFLTELNDKYEVFDNSSYDSIFENLKKSAFQKVDIEKLWEFTLKKSYDNSLSDNILNWRGIELILSYHQVDEFQIFERIEKLMHVKSNLYEFQKANLTKFIVDHLIEIQSDVKLLQLYIITLELMITVILTEKDLFEILKLIKSNEFEKSVEVIQIFLNIYQKQRDIYHPSSFFRFDRENQHLYGPLKKVLEAHSICFAFRLTQKVDQTTKNELFSIQLPDKKKLFSLYLVNKTLNIENSENNSIRPLFEKNSILKDEWNFIEIFVNTKLTSIKLRLNQVEQYIEFKSNSKNFFSFLIKKEKPFYEYRFAIESSIFDYSNIFVIPCNIEKKETSSFYSIMTENNLDLTKVPNFNYCLYSTAKEGVNSSHCKCVKNYNFSSENSNENEVHMTVDFKGRTITNIENIFDYKDSIDVKKFFFSLFDKLDSSSSFSQAVGQTFLSKLLQFFESSKMMNPKVIELYSILLNTIDTKFISFSEMLKFYDLRDSLISDEIIRQFYQSIIFNFRLISRLPSDIQLNFYVNSLAFNFRYINAKSFETILFKAIEYYGEESAVSNSVWKMLSKICDPNNLNDIEPIISVSMNSHISNYIKVKCVTILTDTITQIESNEPLKTKKLFSLSVFLTSLDSIELQMLGIKLFCLVERYFNITENKMNSKQTPINSMKYVYQMIFSSNVSHEISEFNKMTQTIFNYLIPGSFMQDHEEQQFELANSATASVNSISVESSNEVIFSNLTIFPLIVYYSSFCSVETRKDLIKKFISNIRTNYLSSFLDLNSWHFWLTNFLFQFISEEKNLNSDDDLNFFIDPLIELFQIEISFQSSVNKIDEFFNFIRFYSFKFNFNYRTIQILILIKLLINFKESNSIKEISLLYPIIYSALQVEIKNSSFEFIEILNDIENLNEKDTQLFELFTNRYKNNFDFTVKSTSATEQNLRLLLIKTVLDLKENISIQLNSCDINDIYSLTSFILVDYISNDSCTNKGDLLNNYKNTFLSFSKNSAKKYKKCQEILSNVSNKELVISTEKLFFTKYFQEAKLQLKSKIKQTVNLILDDFKASEITTVTIENKKCNEICIRLLKKDSEFNQFYSQKVDNFESYRDEKLGRENRRIERIYNSFLNEKLKDKIERKFKILNQTSPQGTRSLMSVNNNFTSHEENKFSWLGKIDINPENKYKLSKMNNSKFVYFNVKMIKVDEVVDGILSPTESKIVFYSSMKVIEIEYHSILFIFNRLFPFTVDNYKGCEIFTNQNRNFYFIFTGEVTDRDSFYNSLPDYSSYMSLVTKKYQVNSKKTADLNYDETVKFDFFYALRKTCSSIYQNQPSPVIYDRLNLVSKWQNYNLTNYEYVYYLNLLSNRSYQILNFYPYFPVLLKNFESETLDLEDESLYRDLSIPTIFNSHVIDNQDLIRSFPITEHSLTYLLGRVEPFTTNFLNLNAQRFDSRIYYNLKSTLSNQESVQETFNLPFYLVNENGFNLGVKENGEVLNDIILPKWSNNHFTYTFVQRLLFESDFTSKKLPKWIDITFGCSQNSYNGSPIFTNDGSPFLMGCFPDQLRVHPHPDRTIKNDENRQNLLFLMKESNKSNPIGSFPLKEKISKFSKSKIEGIEKEFVYFKYNGSFYVADVNQKPFSYEIVPNESGKLLCVSRPLKLAVFGTKYDDFLTVVDLQKKTISIQCHTNAKVLCAKTIGGRFIITGGSDCVLRVWDMLHNFSIESCSCYHEDEIIAVAGCRSTGLIASIDRSMNLVVETLYGQKLINFVPLEKGNFTPLLEVTKAGLIIVTLKEKLMIFDSRGKEIKNLKFDIVTGFCSSFFGLSLFYDLDTRELLLVGLNSGEVLLVDLTSIDVIGKFTWPKNDTSSKSWSACSMKKCKAALFSDGDQIQVLTFDKLISKTFRNRNSEDIKNVGDMESFCFNYQ